MIKVKTNYQVLIVSSFFADIPYVFKIFQKIKKKNILLVSTDSQKTPELYLNLFKQRKIDLIKIKNVDFGLELNLKSLLSNILKILNNYLVFTKLLFKLEKDCRIYILNDFNSYENFLVYSFFKHFNIKFILPLRFLKIKPILFKQLKDDFINMSDTLSLKPVKKYMMSLRINLFLRNIFCRKEITFAYSHLNKEYMKKRNYSFEHDYYKVLGFSLKSNYKALKIRPACLDSKKNNLHRKSILFLFIPLSSLGSGGINLNKSYSNILNYLKKFSNIHIKIHPNFTKINDYGEFFIKLEKLSKIKYINESNPAEVYISQYKKVIMPCASNSVANYLDSRIDNKCQIISLIKLLVFNKKKTKNYRYQILNVLFNLKKNQILFPIPKR